MLLVPTGTWPAAGEKRGSPENHKFVPVHQERFLSSSPRRLSTHFFSKALVGEHRVLSFLYVMPMHDLDDSAL
jgi:hypothetical protein